MDIDDLKGRRSQLFIGSSREGKRLAEAMQLNMAGELETVVWSQGLFGLSETTVEGLERIARDFDFAALIVTPDDFVESRGHRRPTARDNVLFEAGFFIGRLRRERTFLVCPRDQELGLPSDLAGITVAHYSSPVNGNAQAALGPASTDIKNAILRLGPLHRPITMPASTSPRPTREHVSRPRRCNSLGTAVSRGPKYELRIANISGSGALLETHGEIPVGQDLDLELRLDSGTIVSVTARVMRVQYPDWKRIGGVGVAFTSLSESSALALEAFVQASPAEA
jgi:Predicted nucleotide-binding protein containing TIR-like domain/PilZ domain